MVQNGHVSETCGGISIIETVGKVRGRLCRIYGGLEFENWIS